MAPPAATTSPNRTMQERLVELVKTLQFAWYAGHVTLLLCFVRYCISAVTFNYYTRAARYSYRTAFVAATITYGIVVYKTLRARTRASGKAPNALSVLGDENVQYLALAMVWLFSRQDLLSLLPFAVYSIFHVATYTRSQLLPAIQNQPSVAAGEKPHPNAIADTIGRFVKEYYDASMTLVALLEIALWVRLAGSALVFTKGSWILLAVYSVFLRARFHQSTFVQGAITHLRARGDGVANRQDMPPVVRQIWEGAKSVVTQAGDLTDINRYVGGPQASATGATQQPKKAQ